MIAFNQGDKTMWLEYNPNPFGRSTKDCTVRALTKALNLGWDTAYDILCVTGKKMGYMPDSIPVFEKILRDNGFVKESVPDACTDCYTAEDFASEFFKGTYILVFDGHVATVINGKIYDSVDVSREAPLYFWFRR